MHSFFKTLATGLTLSLFCMTGAAQLVGTPGSLTTLFSSNNGGSNGGAVYFDLEVGPNPLQIIGLDTNTSQIITEFGFKFYTRPGTRSGSEGSMVGWTLRTEGTVTGSGSDSPSSVELNSSVALNAHTLYGVALIMPTNMLHRYTDYTAFPNYSYSNTDITLSLGSASNIPFTSPLFDPRVWNGTIYYNTVPVPEPSTYALMGSCLALVALARKRKKAHGHV